MQDFVSDYITAEEVLEIKKSFDLFDRDLGGSINPQGTFFNMQNLLRPSNPWESRLKLRQSTL